MALGRISGSTLVNMTPVHIGRIIAPVKRRIQNRVKINVTLLSIAIGKADITATKQRHTAAGNIFYERKPPSLSMTKPLAMPPTIGPENPTVPK